MALPVTMRSAHQAPDRLSFGNLETGDQLVVQYNPPELEEQIAIAYERLKVLGQSHQPLQYTGTENLKLSFDLSFDALARRGADAYNIMGARSFLMAFAYGRRGATSIRSGAPPSAIVLWPNLYSLTCKLTTYRGKFTRFQQNGTPTAFTIHVEAEELRDIRLWGDDVAVQATLRGAGVNTTEKS